MPVEPSPALARLFSSQPQLAFLGGSGISVDAPSSQPSGFELMTALVSALIPAEVQPTIQALLRPPSAESGEDGKMLRFEELMLHLQKWDPQLHVLDGYAACREPNENHLALSWLITRGHQVFTTNFDCLIECGLDTVSKSVAAAFPVIARDQWESAETHSNTVYKLHGSLLNQRTGADCRDSIQATLRQIARAKEKAVGLEPWKYRQLERALQHRPLVIVGYSGLDDLDVLPALRRIDSDQPLIWIQHETGRTLPAATLSSGRSPAEATSHRLTRFLAECADTCRKTSGTWLIQVDTRLFLRWLAASYGALDYAGQDATPDVRVTRTPFSISITLQPSDQWYLAGEILSHVDARNATHCFERAREIAAFGRNVRLMRDCENYIGRQHEWMFVSEDGAAHRLASWHAARDSYERALTRATTLDEPDDRKEQAVILSNIGSLYLMFANASAARKARMFLMRALEIDGALNHEEGLARTHNNLGTAASFLGDLPDAVDHFRRACAIDRTIGDVEHLGTHLANLGKALCDHGDESGVALLREAIELNTALGASMPKASCLNHAGRFYADRREFQKALTFYEEASTLSEQLPPQLRNVIATSLSLVRVALAHDFDAFPAHDIDGRAALLPATGDWQRGMSERQAFYFDVANQLSDSKQYAMADAYYQKALALSNHPDVMNGKGGNFTRWSRLDDAERALRQCLALDDRHARAHKNLADVLLKRGDRAAAIAEYTAALAADEWYANACFGLGNVFVARGDYAKAEDQFRRAAYIEPVDGKSFFNLGIVLDAQDKLHEALAAFEEAQVLEPGLPHVASFIDEIRGRLS